MIRLESDVLVIGAGGAGIYAAIAAARDGCRVMLIDRSLIGRGGATIMAQMTVSVALGEQCPDHWEHHLADTLAAGRGLCDPALTDYVCRLLIDFVHVDNMAFADEAILTPADEIAEVVTKAEQVADMPGPHASGADDSDANAVVRASRDACLRRGPRRPARRVPAHPISAIREYTTIPKA